MPVEGKDYPGGEYADDERVLSLLSLSEVFSDQEKALLRRLFRDYPQWHRTLFEIYSAIGNGQTAGTAEERVKSDIDEWMLEKLLDIAAAGVAMASADLELLKSCPHLFEKFPLLKEKFIHYHLAMQTGSNEGVVAFKAELNKTVRSLKRLK